METLGPPNPQRFSLPSPSLGTDSPHDSVMYSETTGGPLAGAGAALAGSARPETTRQESDALGSDLSEKTEPGVGRRSGRRRRLLWLAGLAAIFIVAAAVAIPVGIVFGEKKNGNGSTVTTEDGTTFTYVNKFGGFWVDDPAGPFNNNARPNSWTPPLNSSWRWGVDKVYGVNLGGWLMLEPFIAPALFGKYQNLSTPVIDEWSLSQAMAADTSAGGGLSQIEDHYNTFITEQDIAQIAGAGLNWIRVPIPYWTVDKWTTTNGTEPFLARTSWKYTLRLFR
ncbi:hypothetical protein M0805_008438 [Coniferiporia weirii]|nr:hypothetical protein M0805_008438 [Coniferiporia weirii]